jgi:Protein of unknown function (DUF4230)
MIKNLWQRLRNSKLLQRIPRWLKIALLVLLVWWLLQLFSVLPSFGDIFGQKAVVIEDTPMLIKEIKSIAQLVSIESYDEVVADSTKVADLKKEVEQSYLGRVLQVPVYITIPQIVIIGKGKVVAGTDLQQLKETDFFVQKDSVSLTLPKAQIIDIIINPSGFETFSEAGNWSDAEVKLVKEKIKKKMEQRALARNILTKADARAKLVMEGFLRSAGFKKVLVRITE